MRIISLFVLIAAVLPAVNSTLTTAELLAELPDCGLTCLLKAIENSTCAATDEHCLCTNVQLNDAVTLCVEETCTVKEELQTKNLTSTSCDDPIRDRRVFYDTVSDVMGTVSGLSVGLRMVARYLSDSNFWMDDYVIILTLIIGVPNTVINVYGLTANGLGRDIWTIPFNNITAMTHAFFAAEIIYFTLIALIKISILFFYLRLFPGRAIRRLIIGTIGFNVMIIVLFDLLALFQCRPISYYWTKWDGEGTGTCLNNNALAWANAAISIAMDVWMLSLPLTQLVHLQLHWKKKIGVGMMFSVGAFVTIVSILRLHSLVTFSNSDNPTWDDVAIGLWSTIEVNTGVICACMPSLRMLLVRLFPKVLGTTRDGSNTYATKSRSRTTESRLQEEGGADDNARTGGGITYTKTYDIKYSRKQPEDKANSTVELIDLERESSYAQLDG